MRKSLFFLFISFTLFLATFFAKAQDIQWDNTPNRGFVYAISNKEARQILASFHSTFNEKMLHTLVDSFEVKKGWVNRPEKGHFILATVSGNHLNCQYICVFPYQVLLFKEYNALSLQILDQKGHIRDDARVKLGMQRLRMDKQSGTYRLENEFVPEGSNTVSVELDGFRSFFGITKHDVPTWNGGSYENEDGPDFYSYLITDKNKYKPGDKVRFKSYALSGSKLPLKKELEIWLNAYPKYIKLGTIMPYRPGSYSGDFMLNDSLKLSLDVNYTLQLREKTGRTVASCNIKYEDYELFGNKLTVELRQYKHYNPDTNLVIITATDENGLLLKDARAKVLIKTAAILEIFHPLTILPDTLLYTEISLDPDQPTLIPVQPELFRKTNTSYQVIVEVLNTENEKLNATNQAIFYYSNYELITHFSNDTLCYDLLYNHIPLQNTPITMTEYGESEGHEVLLPYKQKINPATTLVRFSNSLISRTVYLNELNPEIKILGGIQKDSFNISVYNPQKLPLSWYVYQGSQLIQKGLGEVIDFRSVIEDRATTYYVELIYTFGGQEHMKQQQFQFREDVLNVTLNMPNRVYPGQEVDATIKVSDQSGNPVGNVDITAIASSGKLNYYLPDLPYYGSGSAPRVKKASYSKSNLSQYSVSLDIDYPKWYKKFRLDTMKYYHFTYPGSTMFQYTHPITDSTQFTVFAMKNGSADKISVIEVDHIPVYFSWTNQPQAYSFYISPCLTHEITLRMREKVIILKNMVFERGQKTILSFDEDHLPADFKVVTLNNRFTAAERSRYSGYIASFQSKVNNYAYLEYEKGIVPLITRSNRPYEQIIAGPIAPGIKTYTDGYMLHTTYKHAGGFAYTFEDNIVYKQDVYNLIPQYLTMGSWNPMNRVNDLVITKDKFITSQQIKPENTWCTRTIEMIDRDTHVKILLPEDRKKLGIFAVIFENCLTQSTTSPYFDKDFHFQRGYYAFPTGCQSAIVLYTDGSYLRQDNIPLKQNIHVVIDLNNAILHDADFRSLSWLDTYYGRDIPFEADGNTRENQMITKRVFNDYHTASNMWGAVYDAATNEPLPGATIMIKGTEHGTITDIDGHFALQLDDYTATLIISFIGYIYQEIEVTRNSEISVAMEPDIQCLDEVVVIGYGVQHKSEVTGSVVSIRGMASVSPSYELPEAAAEEADNIVQDAEESLYRDLLTLSTIRSHFSDVGFWEPKLYTDVHGESTFRVKFPDDITRWDAVVYAMNRRLQTGTTRKSIRSYKPLMAELKVSQFLTCGDSAVFIGKVLNYTSDSIIKGQTEWSAPDKGFRKDIRFNRFYSDVLPVYATGTDSITTSYRFFRDDGYMDGEERTIPLVKQGIIRANGTLSVMKNGDELTMKAQNNQSLIVEVVENQLAVYKNEIYSLVNYHYLCNEQLASKLIGLIDSKLVTQFEGNPFRNDVEVRKIINRLLKNQNKEFLWSWWDVSLHTSYWMSAHILRALKYAKDAGYEVSLDIDNIARKATYQFDFMKSYNIYDVDLLNALATWDANLNYGRYLPVFDSIVRASEYRYRDYYTGKWFTYSHLKEKMLLQEIRQMKGLNYQANALLKYKKEGILGEAYYSEDKPSEYWYNDDLAVNTIAYRITRKDSLLNNLMLPIQLYFLSARKNNSWNTYQSSNVLMAVLPDLLAAGASKDKPASITVRGKEVKTVSEFPYHAELEPGEEITVKKESGIPVFCMQYVNERVTEAKTGVEGFKIKTYFTGNIQKLEAGKPFELIVDVDLEKDVPVDHVMIEVPIPAACSYNDKRQEYTQEETHREYFRNYTSIFCERLSPGKHTYIIKLLPRYTGKYFLNPAQVSLMYLPVVNANTDMKKIEVMHGQ
jgi:alpha-2-macroglobulin